MSTPVPDTLTAIMKEEAREAGLRYTSDESPGISRRLRGKNFAYFGPSGKPIREPAALARIRHLAVPPAWRKVWISPLENGHIQATGRDVRGRKQYRYHERWREQRDQNKYGHMMDFARVLPKIRRRVRRDLARPALDREKVLAALVRLLETTLIRVGNDEYARENHSYGLTTLRNRHVKVHGATIEFNFRGKSGKFHNIHIEDPKVAKIVRRCQDLPGQDLFAYRDAGGEVHSIGSQDVNDYLHRIAGENYTAKDFRTWIGTVLAALAFHELEEVTSATQAKRNVGLVIQSVAKMLGNTPAICRKCYVHPEIVNSYLDGATLATVSQRIGEDLRDSLSRLAPVEAAVLALLQKRLRPVARRNQGKRPARFTRAESVG
jgi:DNA topoisomerase-1